mgnify:CR=1 FL=1
MFNTDFFDEKLNLELNEQKQYFKLSNEDIEVKIKFVALSEESDSDRIRVRFIKKRGSL